MRAKFVIEGEVDIDNLKTDMKDNLYYQADIVINTIKNNIQNNYESRNCKVTKGKISYTVTKTLRIKVDA